MLAYAGTRAPSAGGSMCIRHHFGAVAQLGERNTGSVEVRGSSPLSSTAKFPGPFMVFCLTCRAKSYTSAVEFPLCALRSDAVTPPLCM